jgi:hypothetical protein
MTIDYDRDQLSYALANALRERDKAREALSDWENAALHVEADHPDEKHCGCVPVLRKMLTDAREAFVIVDVSLVIAQGKVREANKERDEAREALMKIEDLFIDGTDIYADREKMGTIARNALEGAK